MPAVELFRDAFGKTWTLEDDRTFWRHVQGQRGLLRLRKDAQQLIACSLGLSEHPSDKAFLVARQRCMTFCIVLSYAERVVCAAFKEWPHFFGRFAAQMFCELLGRAELIVEENAFIYGESGRSKGDPELYRSAADDGFSGDGAGRARDRSRR